jgi:O-antigen ligase
VRIVQTGMPAAARAGGARETLSPAAIAVAVYTFLAVGRLSEMVPSLRLALLVGGMAMLSALMLPRVAGQAPFRTPEARAVLGLFFLSVASIPLSVWPGGAFSFVLNVYSKVVIFFFLLIYCVRSARQAAQVMWGFLIGILAVEMTLLLFGTQTEERWMATEAYDPNDIAFVMVSGLPLAIFRIATRGAARYLAAIIALLAILIIILTRSRGGFVAFLAVGAMLLWWIPSRRPLLRMGLLLAVVVLFGFVVSQAYWNRMATIWGGGGPVVDHTTEFDAEGLSGARWHLWTTGLELMMARPLLGVGAGMFANAEGAAGGRYNTAHNAFIEVGAELGVVGLGLFAFLLWRALQNCRALIRLARRDPQFEPYWWMANGLLISLCGSIVAALALSQGYSPVLYFLVGMSVALKRLATMSQGGQPAGGRVRR